MLFTVKERRIANCWDKMEIPGTLSPALIAKYQTQLPDKKLLQAKLHEFYFRMHPSRPSIRTDSPGLTQYHRHSARKQRAALDKLSP